MEEKKTETQDYNIGRSLVSVHLLHSSFSVILSSSALHGLHGRQQMVTLEFWSSYVKTPTMPTSNFKFPMEKLNGLTWVGHPLPVQLAEIGEGEDDGRRSGRCKVQILLPGAHSCVW